MKNIKFNKLKFNKPTSKQKIRINSRYKQGEFIPINKDKFKVIKNRQNQGKIIYRSSWELKFMEWCDKNPNVIQVISEGVKIPYIFKNKKRNYYPDFIIQYKNEKLIIEIKPEKQKIDEINQAKFNAAKSFSNKRGFKFIILTEKELKNILK